MTENDTPSPAPAETAETRQPDQGGHPIEGGLVLPRIGFGTYPLRGSTGLRILSDALDVGYRMLDSAFNYENEGTVGTAIRASGIPRDQVVVASKLPGRHQEYDKALEIVEESVYRTGLESIDLYLIHWPNPKVGKYVEAWRALIEARERGLVKAIGVSNFLPEHLDRLVAETGVTPVVNQIELHPYFPQEEQRAYHAEHGIVTEAWSPLGRKTDLLGDPVIARIAADHGIEPGHAILSWHLALGTLPLPKSSSPERQRGNLEVPRADLLTADEVAEITALGRPDGRAAGQDPAEYEEF